MSSPIVIDGRNVYDPDKMKEMGFTYLGVGRGFNIERPLIPPAI
jgi:UDPglucose 6-dehydrogenase